MIHDSGDERVRPDAGGPPPGDEGARLHTGDGSGDEGARPDAGAADRDAGARRQSPSGQRPLAPTIILLLVVGGILLGIGLWTGGNDHAAAPPAPAAALTIIEPADSATVAAPLEVTFSTTAPLRLTPMGWQAEHLHLHAIVDGTEIMPGALDIRALGDDRYRWRLKSVVAGSHDIRLVWARPDHRSIPEGASADVSFTVK